MGQTPHLQVCQCLSSILITHCSCRGTLQRSLPPLNPLTLQQQQRRQQDSSSSAAGAQRVGEGPSTLSGSKHARPLVDLCPTTGMQPLLFLPHIALDCVHFANSTYDSWSPPCLCDPKHKGLTVCGTVHTLHCQLPPPPLCLPTAPSPPCPAHLCLVSNCLQLCSNLLRQCLLSTAAPTPTGPPKQLQMGRLAGSQGRCHNTAGSRARQ